MTLDVKAHLRELLAKGEDVPLYGDPPEVETDGHVYLGGKRYRGADVLSILASLPALLDRLERAEKVEARARRVCDLAAEASDLRTTPIVRTSATDATWSAIRSLRAALDDEAPR